MKSLILKTKFKNKLFLFGLITLSSATESIFSTSDTIQINETPEEQITKVLKECLFNKNNKKPFSYFIDEIIYIVTVNKDYFEKKHNHVGLVDIFVKDLQSIRGNRISLKMHLGSIRTTLKRYKHYKGFVPPFLKELSENQLEIDLVFRLNII